MLPTTLTLILAPSFRTGSLAGLIRLCLLLVAGMLSPLSAYADGRTNFIVVLCDDLGYGDLHCYGDKELRTPHLDRFAAEGLRLTSCYAAHPNCSPSRTGLMTGRTPTRVGIHSWIPMLSPMHVPAEEVTIATLLREAGYETAMAGKWHLNGRFNLTGQPQPGDHGFDHWFATQNNCLPNHRNPYNFVRNGIPLGPLQGFAADLVSKEAIYWLRGVRDRSKPFFLFVSFHEPHEPIATAAKYQTLYPSDDPSYSAHHGNITQMDAAFGTLMATVDDLGLRDDTLVIFTSDNGPAKTAIHPSGSAGPLRDHKGYISDGGIRVPGIVRWLWARPARERVGRAGDRHGSASHALRDRGHRSACGPQDRRDQSGAADARASGRSSDTVVLAFLRRRGNHQVAIRIDQWKLSAEIAAEPVRQRGGIDPRDQQAIKAAPLGKMELFNLDRDIGETEDLKAIEPGRFKEMRMILESMYRDVPAGDARVACVGVRSLRGSADRMANVSRRQTCRTPYACHPGTVSGQSADRIDRVNASNGSRSVDVFQAEGDALGVVGSVAKRGCRPLLTDGRVGEIDGQARVDRSGDLKGFGHGDDAVADRDVKPGEPLPAERDVQFGDPTEGVIDEAAGVGLPYE